MHTYWKDSTGCLVIQVDKKDKETGEYTAGRTFYLVKEDGSPGWRYQAMRPITEELTVDKFIESCGLQTRDFSQTDCKKKVYQFTTFLVEDLEMCQEGGKFWVEVKLYLPAFDITIDFAGGKATRQRIAKKRFFNKFNLAYQGCFMDDEDDEMEESIPDSE